MSPLETFERIKESAKRCHLSLSEVNDKAGLVTRSIYHWKIAEPTTNNLNAVARVLHVNPDYLRGKTDDPRPVISRQGDTDLNTMIDSARSYDGKPVTSKDRKLIKEYLKALYGDR